MNRAKQQIIGSILATVALSLLVLMPVWIANTLEQVETARSDIHTYGEIASTTTEQVITPWWQFENETSVPDDDETTVTDTGAYFSGFGWETYKNPTVTSWDINGYWDMFITPSEESGRVWLQHKGGMSPGALLVAGIYDVSIGVNFPGNYSIFEVSFWFGNGYWTSAVQPVTIPSGWGDTTTGLNYYNFSIDNDEVTAAASEGGMYPVNGMLVIVDFPDGFAEGEVIETNWKICPEYLIENVTIEGNTTYKPYILTYSNPNTWTEWGLGASGFFFLLTAAVINPLINPSKIIKGNLKRRGN
jgi:hypothetical protein